MGTSTGAAVGRWCRGRRGCRRLRGRRPGRLRTRAANRHQHHRGDHSHQRKQRDPADQHPLQHATAARRCRPGWLRLPGGLRWRRRPCRRTGLGWCDRFRGRHRKRRPARVRSRWTGARAAGEGRRAGDSARPSSRWTAPPPASRQRPWRPTCRTGAAAPLSGPADRCRARPAHRARASPAARGGRRPTRRSGCSDRRRRTGPVRRAARRGTGRRTSPGPEGRRRSGRRGRGGACGRRSRSPGRACCRGG